MKILIIEDDLISQITLKKYLARLGYGEIVVVESGKDAFEIIQNSDIDVAFVDIHIEGNKDGIETVAEINKMSPHITVIYLTASADKQVLSQIERTNYLGFIIKPVSIEVIEQHLKKIESLKNA